MSRTKAFFSAICFSSVGLFASAGFAQDFYQPAVGYSQSYTVEPYSVQYMPSQYTTSDVVGIPSVGDSSSLSVPTQTYPTQTYPTQTYPTQTDPAQTYSSVQGSVIQESDLQKGPDGVYISPDYGYAGPGDMRTHLWNDHSADLKANGVSQEKLMSMPMATVQKWHNFFHGTQGRPQE